MASKHPQGTRSSAAAAAAEDDEEEDDYLTMTFPTSTPSLRSTSTTETSLQRTARLKREAALRARVPSKSERAAQSAAALQTGLNTRLDTSNNKGASMLAKMGFKGGALGAKVIGAEASEDASGNGLTEPIALAFKAGRGGIGLMHEDGDGERGVKRKGASDSDSIQDQDSGEKRPKVTVEDYRDRTVNERKEKRSEGQWWSAMKTLEGFAIDAGNGGKVDSEWNDRPLRAVPLLVRPLVKSRRDAEHRRRMRYDLDQSLSRQRDYELDPDDRLALGNAVEEVGDDLEEDEELIALEALPATEKLEQVVKGLREQHHYCFWCKYQYPDETMDGCPGLGEDEHG